MGDVKAIGDRVLWLDRGRVRELGPTDLVVSKYLAAMVEKDSAYLELSRPEGRGAIRLAAGPTEVETRIPNIDHRYGDGRAEILGIGLYNEHGARVQLLEPNTKVVVRVSARAHERVSCPNVGFMLRNHMGIDFAGTNTLREGIELPAMHAGEIVTVDFYVDLPALYPAHFSFSPAIADGALMHYKMCDWIDNAITVQMGHTDAPIYGYMHLPCKVEVNSRLHAASEAGPERVAAR
jgi:hypothetical protein